LLGLQAAARAASTVQFAPGAIRSVTEGGSITLSLTINPPLPSTNNATVKIVQTGGTADSSDFSLDSPVLTGGATATWLNLYAIDDGLPENDETLRLTLETLSDGVVIGSRSNITVTIKNLSQPWVELQQFDPMGEDAWSVNEDVGTAEFHIYRHGDTNSAFTV